MPYWWKQQTFEPDITHLITNQSQQPFCIKYMSHDLLLEAADF